MKIERTITTVDSHTAGEPTRMITAGLPPLVGETIAEKMNFFRDNFDFIRTSLICEPRGHRDMVGVVLIPPVRKEAHYGAFFLDLEGCNPMCGHGTIGVCVTIAKLGWVDTREADGKVVLDTPAGLVSCRLNRMEDGDISASLCNVPSFPVAEKVKIGLPEGEIAVDVVFSGNFFVLVDSSSLREKLGPENIASYIQLADRITHLVNRAVDIAHPFEKGIRGVRFVYFYGLSRKPGSYCRSLVVGGKGNVDRSPCGTGTSALLALLFARNQIALGERICVESITGTTFEARIVEEKRIGEFRAVIPEITATAYITGFHQFLIETDDPLKHGFIL